MNRQQLKERLVAAGVPEGNYFIVGIDSQTTPGKGGGFGEIVVAPTEDERGWRLFTEERGQIQYEAGFATEDEACDAAWEKLQPRHRTIRQRTPEERERSRARAREAMAEYERAAENYQSGNPN